MKNIYDRRTITNTLHSRLSEGRTILLYGPKGSGKTTILKNVARRIKKDRRPCGLCKMTRALSDVTGALLQAYPSVSTKSRSRRSVRFALDTAVEANPGILLLDHVHAVGTQVRGFLRSLLGTGLGVLMAADVEGERDHRKYRAMRLAYEEETVPPLPGRYMRCIFRNAVPDDALPFPLTEADLRGLLRCARGRPGWIIRMGELLQLENYWHKGRVLKESIYIQLLCETETAYCSSPEAHHQNLGPGGNHAE